MSCHIWIIHWLQTRCCFVAVSQRFPELVLWPPLAVPWYSSPWPWTFRTVSLPLSIIVCVNAGPKIRIMTQSNNIFITWFCWWEYECRVNHVVMSRTWSHNLSESHRKADHILSWLDLWIGPNRLICADGTSSKQSYLSFWVWRQNKGRRGGLMGRHEGMPAIFANHAWKQILPTLPFYRQTGFSNRDSLACRV